MCSPCLAVPHGRHKSVKDLPLHGTWRRCTYLVSLLAGPRRMRGVPEEGVAGQLAARCVACHASHVL